MPLTEFTRHRYLMKILLFLLVESVYFTYIVMTKPHSDNMYNELEYFNETLMMLLAYLMLPFAGLGWSVGSMETLPVLVVITLITIGNLQVLIRLSYRKIILKLRKAKA